MAHVPCPLQKRKHHRCSRQWSPSARWLHPRTGTHTQPQVQPRSHRTATRCPGLRHSAKRAGVAAAAGTHPAPCARWRRCWRRCYCCCQKSAPRTCARQRTTQTQPPPSPLCTLPTTTAADNGHTGGSTARHSRQSGGSMTAGGRRAITAARCHSDEEGEHGVGGWVGGGCDQPPPTV
jgi:hypothetical protein